MSKKPPVVTSKTILEALRYKHSEDIFVPECKNGSSYGGHLRMDAWVSAKSWANPSTTVYEIKVNRSDFLGDNKWPGYLPYCNYFYFVCPSKLISVDEVPPDAGLMYLSSTGTRLYTKKKAPYRQVDIPEDLYRYILMWRSIVTRESNSSTVSRKEFWENWLEERKINSSFGYQVGKILRKTIEKKIDDVNETNKSLQRRFEKYDHLLEFLKEIDVDPETYSPRRSVETKLKELDLLIPDDLKWSIIHAKDNLVQLTEKLEELNKKRKG